MAGTVTPSARTPTRAPGAAASRTPTSRTLTSRTPTSRTPTSRTPTSRTVGSSQSRSWPVALVGIGVALWTAVLGLATVVCLVLVGWVASDHHGDALAPAMRTATEAWLLAHHGVVEVGGARIGVVPLGLTWLLAVALAHGGRQAVRLTVAISALDALVVAVAVALPYSIAVALLTRAASTSGVRVAPLPALGGAFALSLLSVAFGALRETGRLSELTGRLPAHARSVLGAVAAATCVLLGIGAAVAIVSLAASAGRAAQLAQSLHGGASGSLLLAGMSAAYAPNAVIWAAALSVGPGFAVGAGTSVSLGGVHLGAVPAFPLFAALPSGTHLPAAGWLVLVAPVAACGLAGHWITRAPASITIADAPDSCPPWWHRHYLPDAGRAALAGVLSGVLLGVLAALAAGPGGPGRMALLGPSGWWVGLAAALEIGAGAAAVAWVSCWLRARRLDAAAVGA